ncbi:uncharacterized protein LOC132789780 [Drosophila nasuta]|uniref:uncharacterized protein LOC132789780 n=1 Tax=Drosophila nasuta TaxID=42062 RepID=UPI00295F441E|nr:uncharacterized protein LOC132789780 [Drosophila nasuta]
MAALPDRFNAGKRLFWCEFLKLYEQMPELWNVHNLDYRNKELRNESYEILQTKLKEIEPNATKADVGRRINIFRTNYRREQMRIWKQQELGLHPNLCKPTLWFYENMSFLQTQESFQHRSKRSRLWNKQDTPQDFKADVGSHSSSEVPESSLSFLQHLQSNLDPLDTTPTAFLAPATTNRDTMPTAFDESMLISPKIEIFDSDPSMEVNRQGLNDDVKMDNVNSSIPDIGEPNGSSAPASTAMKGLQTDNASPILSEASEALAKSWAIQYEEMAPTQRILARKAIADILFEGCMGNLRVNRGDRTTVVNNV